MFLYGFSHGSKGKALRGKKLVVSVTVGAPQAFYRADEGDLDRFLAYVEATCALTGMEYAGSVCTYGVPYLNRGDEAARSDMVEKSREHAARLVRFVEGLSVGPAAD